MLFLFFLLVSCCLWLMLTLNQDYETDITIDVHIKDVPENIGFLSTGEECVVVKVRDRGTTLMNYAFSSFLPISVSYSELKNRKGRLSLPVSVLRKRIEGQMLSSTTVLSMQPDSFVYFTRESALRLPVRIDGRYSVAKQYAAGKPLVRPDSVWVYAPSSVADTLEFVTTAFFEQDELRDSLYMNVDLRMPSGVKCVPSQVSVVVPVSPFAEKSFELPVTGVDFPAQYRLRTFPPRVAVVMNVDMALYDSVTEDEFKVGILYSDIEGSTSSNARPRLLKTSKNVRDVRIVPSEVEYLIEQQ